MANRRNYSVSMNGTGSRQSENSPPVLSSQIHLVASRTGSDYSRRKPVGQRWVPPTSYSMTETSYQNSTGTYAFYVTPTNFGRETGVLPQHTSASSLVASFHSATGVPSSFPSDLANRALINARNNLKGTSLDLGVAWGERRETAKFVGDTFGTMANFLGALKDARKLKTRKAKRRLERVVQGITGRDGLDAFKKIPTLRLQWQYAVRPLMSDIYNAVTVLDDHANDRWKVTVKGKSNYKTKMDVDINKTSSRDQCRVKADIFYGCMVRIDVQPGNNALRKASQLGLTNPVNLAWELIPLSFVVDWAYPLGDYFASLDAMVGWELLGCSSSNFTRRKYQFTGNKAKIGSINVTEANWSARYRTVTLNRAALTSVPFPTLPSVKDPRSHSHVADGFALLAQAIKAFGR